MVHCLSNLVLKCFGGVGSGNLEVVFIYKILYFGFIVLYREYDHGISFVNCCYNGLFGFDFGLN
jgi:hypothetical protein